MYRGIYTCAYSHVCMYVYLCAYIYIYIIIYIYGLGHIPPCISAPLRQIQSDLVYKHQNTGIVYKPIRNHLVPKHQMLRTCRM